MMDTEDRDYAKEAFIRRIYCLRLRGGDCSLEEFSAMFGEFDRFRSDEVKTLRRIASDAVNCQARIYFMEKQRT